MTEFGRCTFELHTATAQAKWTTGKLEYAIPIHY